MFDCYEARLHTLPDAPTLRTATHEQRVDHYERFKRLNANTIVPRFGIEADDEHGFFESAFYGILQEEDYWKQCGIVWAWIDRKPVWVSAGDWNHVLPELTKPCVRQFRMTLLGGGQIKVTEEFERVESDILDWFICYEPKLRVQAQTAESGLRTYSGIISHGAVCEMATYAVLFPPKTPQEIADRTAQTMRLVDAANNGAAENFLALLARSERCSCCNRPLRDEVSKLLGIGPDCASRMRLPHNQEAAGRVLKLRRELLGEDVASPRITEGK